MDYPEEVQEYIDYLDEYRVNDNLAVFDIIHMYPKGLAYPDGYYDSQFFDMVLFNTSTKEKRTVENRDGLTFYNGIPYMVRMRIFADGSTVIVFNGTMGLDLLFQDVVIKKAIYNEHGLYN